METHEVIFFRAVLFNVKACKSYAEAGGDPVEGFSICLEGTTSSGEEVGPMCDFTRPDGCVTFEGLFAGDYRIWEMLPPDSSWEPLGPTSMEVAIPGDGLEFEFVNFCRGKLEMHTKGYWQNQGCDVATASDLDFLNSMPPYAGGSVMTNGQDNCTGTPCPDVTILPFDSVSEPGVLRRSLSGQLSGLM